MTIRSLSSLWRLARSSLPPRPALWSAIISPSSRIRFETCSSRFIRGWTFWVRIESSSTSVTALWRRSLSDWRRVRRPERSFRARTYDRKSRSLQVHQVGEGGQVVRHPAEDLVLLQVLGDGDLHGPVEGQLAVVDLLEDVDDQAEGVVALQDLAAEPLAGDLDLLGQADLLVAGEQGDLAHLRQVHPDRVVDPPGDLVEVLGGQLAVVVVVLVVDRCPRARRRSRRRR